MKNPRNALQQFLASINVHKAELAQFLELYDKLYSSAAPLSKDVAALNREARIGQAIAQAATEGDSD